MHRCFSLLAIVAMAVLTGCATKIPKQEFNAEAASHIKHLAVTRYADPAEIDVVVINHAGVSFGLIGGLIAAADMSSKSARFSAALGVGKLQPATVFNDKLQSALKSKGYALTPLSVAREAKDEEAKFKLAAVAATDAGLQVRTHTAFVAAGSSSDYMPSVVANVELIERNSNKVLYRERFNYGFNNVHSGESVYLAAAPECRFANFDALISRTEQASKCLMDGVDAVAQAIASDLQR